MKNSVITLVALAAISAAPLALAQNQSPNAQQNQQTVSPQGTNSAGAVTNEKKSTKHVSRKSRHHVASTRSHRHVAKKSTTGRSAKTKNMNQPNMTGQGASTTGQGLSTTTGQGSQERSPTKQ